MNRGACVLCDRAERARRAACRQGRVRTRPVDSWAISGFPSSFEPTKPLYFGLNRSGPGNLLSSGRLRGRGQDDRRSGGSAGPSLPICVAVSSGAKHLFGYSTGLTTERWRQLPRFLLWVRSIGCAVSPRVYSDGAVLACGRAAGPLQWRFPRDEIRRDVSLEVMVRTLTRARLRRVRSLDRTRSLCGVQIVGIGSYLPERVVTNEELQRTLGFDPAWIIQRTGIKQRRFAAPDQATSDLCVEAARRCIDSAHVDVRDIDLLIVATFTPDSTAPATACIVQDQLG